jgi:hypothetical protein
MILGYPLMARLPNDEIVISKGATLSCDSTLVLNILPLKYNKQLAENN